MTIHFQFEDYLYMGLGMVPVLLVFLATFTTGLSTLVSLRSIYVLCIWVQYHLSPWLALRVGGWDSILLRAPFISDGLLFSTLCMFGITIGYGRYIPLSGHSSKQFELYKSNLIRLTPEILTITSFVFLALSFFSTILYIGSFDILLYYDGTRGAGQFDNIGIIQSLINQLRTISIVSGLISIILMSIMFSESKSQNKIAIFPLLFVFILISSIPLMHSFSRVSGAMFITASVIIVTIKKPNIPTYIISLLFITIGIYLSQIGITHRGIVDGGIMPFIIAALDPHATQLSSNLDYVNGEVLIGPGTNFLDALAPFTALVWAAGNVQTSTIDSLLKLLLILQPLPTSFFGGSEAFRVGPTLSVVFGTYGSTGITKPALSELYLLFGNWGAIFLFLLGWVLKAVDTDIRRRGRMLMLIPYMFCIVAIVAAGHNGLRAFARPFVIALTLFWFFRFQAANLLNRTISRAN
ncbi:hypothetical protein HW532_13855 [Kaustia mangrovi]|uniref:Uncharacterized protein n=1 Tax=Kaustia mangrovi TaxID=2593653 RepID=A0A7S8C5B3_9HYPH|nr:hypothetical protein [Kaustia mangrovi]QPC43676.1 hypothetical protein HW532_13855 [Kaustia mangrovi]